MRLFGARSLWVPGRALRSEGTLRNFFFHLLSRPFFVREDADTRFLRALPSERPFYPNLFTLRLTQRAPPIDRFRPSSDIP